MQVHKRYKIKRNLVEANFQSIHFSHNCNVSNTECKEQVHRIEIGNDKLTEIQFFFSRSRVQRKLSISPRKRNYFAILQR